jgi:hypothetical protein
MAIATAARLFLSEQRDEDFTKLVRRIPVEDLEDQQMETIMRVLILPCLEFENKHACRTVIKEFNVDEQLDVLTRIFLFKSFDDLLLSFIVRCHPERSPQEHYSNLIGYEDRSVCSFAAARIKRIYGNDVPTDKYIELFNYACDDQNTVMRQFIQNQIKENNVQAEPPTWLIENKKGWEIPEPPENNFKIPESKEDQIELLLKVLGSGNINLDTERKREGKEIEIKGEPEISEYAAQGHITDPKVIEAYGRMDEEQKRNLIEDAFEQYRINRLFTDREYNRLLGPANAQANGTYFDKSHRCNKYGGCRMLTCVCSEESNDQEQTMCMELDWFTGACDRCFRIIPSRSHAIREPLIEGGWRGCYCSSVRDDDGNIIRGYCLKSMVHITDPQVDEITDNLIDQYLDLLERDKIYDRSQGHDTITEYLTQFEFNYNYYETGFPETEIEATFYDENGYIDEEQDLAPKEPGELTIEQLADLPEGEDLGEKAILEALTNETFPLPVSTIVRPRP